MSANVNNNQQQLVNQPNSYQPNAYNGQVNAGVNRQQYNPPPNNQAYAPPQHMINQAYGNQAYGYNNNQTYSNNNQNYQAFKGKGVKIGGN